MIARVESGEIRPKRLRANRAESLEINRRYRAIRYVNKDHWFVCSHEKYNKICERK